MTRRLRSNASEPKLLELYIEAGRNGHEIHAEYARRWLAWHAETCNKRPCDHRSHHGIAERLAGSGDVAA